MLVVGKSGGALSSVGLPVPGTTVRPSRRRALGRGLALLLFLAGVWVCLGVLAGTAQADETSTDESSTAVVQDEHPGRWEDGDEPPDRPKYVEVPDDDHADEAAVPAETSSVTTPAEPAAPAPAPAALAPAPAALAPAVPVPVPVPAPAPATRAPAPSAIFSTPTAPARLTATAPTAPATSAASTQLGTPSAPAAPAVPTAPAAPTPPGPTPVTWAPTNHAPPTPGLPTRPTTSAHPKGGAAAPDAADEDASRPGSSHTAEDPAAAAGPAPVRGAQTAEDARTAEEAVEAKAADRAQSADEQAGALDIAAPAPCDVRAAAAPDGSAEGAVSSGGDPPSATADEGTMRTLGGEVANEGSAESSGSHPGSQALSFVPSSGSTDPPPAPPPPSAPLPPPLPVTPPAPAGSCPGASAGGHSSGAGQHCASALDLAVLGTGIRVPPLSATGLPHIHAVDSITERASDPGSSPD